MRMYARCQSFHLSLLLLNFLRSRFHLNLTLTFFTGLAFIWEDAKKTNNFLGYSQSVRQTDGLALASPPFSKTKTNSDLSTTAALPFYFPKTITVEEVGVEWRKTRTRHVNKVKLIILVLFPLPVLHRLSPVARRRKVGAEMRRMKEPPLLWRERG